MPGEICPLQRHLEIPGATQGAKYSLGEPKLPRASWVSLGPNPFFLMQGSTDTSLEPPFSSSCGDCYSS